jgi:hypothetical protein
MGDRSRKRPDTSQARGPIAEPRELTPNLARGQSLTGIVCEGHDDGIGIRKSERLSVSVVRVEGVHLAQGVCHCVQLPALISGCAAVVRVRGDIRNIGAWPILAA